MDVLFMYPMQIGNITIQLQILKPMIRRKHETNAGTDPI